MICSDISTSWAMGMARRVEDPAVPSILSYAHSERGRAIRRRLHLLTVLGPLYGRHLVRRPFARTLRYVPGYRRASGLSNRHRQALYDSVLECLLRAYFRELRARYSPTTGPMLTLLIDVMKHLDMYLDAAETGGQIRAVAEILDVDGIRGPYEAFKEFAATHGQSEPVIRYLRNGFESHFPTYLGNMNRATRTGDPAAILDMAKDDSGFELRALMEMAALYNSTEPSDQAGRQVYAVGMVGKLADDMVDLKRDVRDGGINLLVTYV